MEQWKKMVFQVFGKKSKKKWKTFVMNIMSVDIGIKKAYLFDLWSCSKEELDTLIQNLHELQLVDNNLGTLTIESDLLVYSRQSFQNLSPVDMPMVVDVSSSLEQPVVMSKGKEKEAYSATLLVFEHFLKFISQANGDHSDTSRLVQHYDIQVSEMVNPPCLFGLALGYPLVYWFNRREGEDNCLSMQPLHLYLVKGSVRTDVECQGNGHTRPVEKTHNAVKLSEKPEVTELSSVAPYSADHDICSPILSACVNKEQSHEHHLGHQPDSSTENKSSICSTHKNTNNNMDHHVIFSFTIPEKILTAVIKSNVQNWFSTWRSTVSWFSLFSDVWMEEELMKPQAVCL